MQAPAELLRALRIAAMQNGFGASSATKTCNYKILEPCSSKVKMEAENLRALWELFFAPIYLGPK